MLVFVFDNLQQRWLPSLPRPAGHFDVMLIRFLICVGIAIALAVLSRRYFEEPFLRLKDRPSFGRTAPAIRDVATAAAPALQPDDSAA